jgi:hypothetical protein
MKTIQNDTHIMWVDKTNTINKGNWVEEKGTIYQLDIGHSGAHNWNKIIAAYPKLEGCYEFETLPPNKMTYGEYMLSNPEIPNTEDYVEKLALEKYPVLHQLGQPKFLDANFNDRKIWIDGYTQAKSETMFSYADAEKIYMKGYMDKADGKDHTNEKLSDYLQSLTKLKWEFVPQMESVVAPYEPQGCDFPDYVEQPKVENNKIYGEWKKI